MKIYFSFFILSITSLVFSQIHHFSQTVNTFLDEQITSQTKEKNIQNPIFILDGISYTNDIPQNWKNITLDEIGSISYLGREFEDLPKIWGDKTKDGVLFISLKNNHSEEETKKDYHPDSILYFFDESLVKAEALKDISPNDIKEVKVIKKEFTDIHGKNYNGIIIITPFISIR